MATSNINNYKSSSTVNDETNTIPASYKHLMKYGIYVFPLSTFLSPSQNANDLNHKWLTELKSSPAVKSCNTLHKTTHANPIHEPELTQLLSSIDTVATKLLELPPRNHSLHAQFGISYESDSKDHNQKLELHMDDSTYTINLCLENTAISNELVFSVGKKYETPVHIAAGFVCVHKGTIPHYVNPIRQGTRTNIVIWMK